MHKIKIVIVDDHPIVLQGFKQLLVDQEQLQIVGVFEEGLPVESFLKNNPIDVVLMDISLPDINGVLLCKQVKTRFPKTVVLMISNRSERSIILEAIANGASGYLLKNASIDELLLCIQQAVKGNTVYSKEVKDILNKPLPQNSTEVPNLTKREKEILVLLMEGKNQ